MLNVQAALTAAGVPGWRDAFRPLPGVPDPPDMYCVYQIIRTPIWPADDEPTAELKRAVLILFSQNTPESFQAAIEAAMREEGFELTLAEDDYEPGAGLYVVKSQWEGIQ